MPIDLELFTLVVYLETFCSMLRFLVKSTDPREPVHATVVCTKEAMLCAGSTPYLAPFRKQSLYNLLAFDHALQISPVWHDVSPSPS